VLTGRSVAEVADVAAGPESEHVETTRQLNVVITLRCDLPEAAERAGTAAIDEAAREQNRWFNGGLELTELLERAEKSSIRAVITPAQPTA
jgi:hypothetical protein